MVFVYSIAPIFINAHFHILGVENLQLTSLFNILQDLVFHVVWMLCWFIAAVEWAVAQNILNGVMVSILEDQFNENCTTPYNSTTFETSGYVQAAIGDVSYGCSNEISFNLKICILS